MGTKSHNEGIVGGTFEPSRRWFIWVSQDKLCSTVRKIYRNEFYELLISFEAVYVGVTHSKLSKTLNTRYLITRPPNIADPDQTGPWKVATYGGEVWFGV